MTLLQNINSPADLRLLPLDQLQQVADEIRQYILETMSRVGGHTGASLGAVELAVALHYAFDTPQDRLVWDVGHQAYAHKILTGRRDLLPTVKQYGGISGFLRRDESEYDAFGAGHASTSLSAALGMAIARDRQGENHNVVALIGDASLAGGMAMEAINQAGHLKTRLIVLLNDNEMSIAPAVGALTGYLNRIREAHGYHRFKDEVEEKLLSIPSVGGRLHHAAKTVKDAIAAAVLPGALVNELGFKYIGYVDGHNVRGLVAALREAQQVKDGPVIVHALTTKGKGHPAAEKDYYKWHATGPFDLKTGTPIKSPAKAPTYTQVFGETLCELMAKDEKVVALTAAMPDGTGVALPLEKFPERSFDVGIAEQHCVTFAAGLSCEGLKPICAIYSTFLQRAFDQLVHDVCLQNLNVKFCLDRGGIAGGDGPTHHGLLDIAYLRVVPNIVLMAPKDEGEMRDMMFTMNEYVGPAAMRYPRGNGMGVPIDGEPQILEIGKAELLRDGGEIAIVAYGSMVHPSLQAAENLAKEGIEATVINARFVKPLDSALLLALARTKRLIVTVEEAYLAGGFGSAVIELLEENGLQDKVRVVRMGVPDRIVTHGDAKLLLAKYGLDPDGIYTRVKEAVEVLEDRRAKPQKVTA
ncbi:MAG: 1-deoxy-D-xylulose-5-phosphate synthase [Blastocatellia bacterium]|jgi:1-deoxy-D-xylulose-5-phosphate synthase|nr:1-deoxy-D-xylulose-5-phosphate synthase [Blastocatellia bacterium]MDX6574514.1 1-deoxy-D-xylulose-5-phosphate synthase [Blastocatellia bacterium]